MKVILKEDIKSLGKKGEIVNVSDGYARNFLIRTGKGVEASNKNLNDLKFQAARDAKIAMEEYEAARQLGETIEKGKISLSIKMGEGGRAFGSISSREIAAEVERQMGLVIDKKKIQMKDLIKTVGEHSVKIKLHPNVTSHLKVVVNEEL